jgi:hypothetical protein
MLFSNKDALECFLLHQNLGLVLLSIVLTM